MTDVQYDPATLRPIAKQESATLVWGRLRRLGLSRGLVPGGLRRPGTQSVCLRPDLGSNRPEKWLSRFLVPDRSGTL